MPSEREEQISETLKKAIAILRDANVPFLLGGSLASWARGGPGSTHDVDFMLKRDDAERALDALVQAGMRGERPPEGWLLKAWDGDVLVDLIFEPTGLPITDEVLARGEEVQAQAVLMPVMALEDVLVTKLRSLTEHNLSYDSLLAIARALRERIDWADVRGRAGDSPYVQAFFTIVEGLGVVAPASADASRA
jgi:predicted nucleotidyltransferase